jgi:VQ motif
MATTKTAEGASTNTTSSVISPISGESNNGNTVYIHVEPSHFQAVVQKLTGASINSTPTLPISSLPPPKRPRLQVSNLVFKHYLIVLLYYIV